MSTTTAKLDNARTALALAGEEQHRDCLKLQAARQLKSDLYNQIIAGLQARLEKKMPDQMSNVSSHINCSTGTSLAAACSLVACMESDLAFVTAEEVIAPLLVEIADLEAVIANDQHQARLAENERQAKIDQAKAEAHREIEARYAIPEPPAPAEPAPLIRGRIKTIA